MSDQAALNIQTLQLLGTVVEKLANLDSRVSDIIKKQPEKEEQMKEDPKDEDICQIVDNMLPNF